MTRATMFRARTLPHLGYAKDAKEAASFSTSIFPGSRVNRVTPIMSESPSGPAGSVEVVDVTLFGQRFQAISQIVPAGFEAMMRDGDPERSKRVTDAMVKLDVAALERAYGS